MGVISTMFIIYTHNKKLLSFLYDSVVILLNIAEQV